jgi:hypothetical protein
MTPPQALLQQDLVDAAALDGDALLLVEVGLQAVERPAAEREPQVLRIGQRGGDDLGTLLGGVGRRTSGSGSILQAGKASLVEATEPGVDRGPRNAQFIGDLAGASTVGEGQQELSPLDEAGLGRARRRELFEGLTFLRGYWPSRN